MHGTTDPSAGHRSDDAPDAEQRVKPIVPANGQSANAARPAPSRQPLRRMEQAVLLGSLHTCSPRDQVRRSHHQYQFALTTVQWTLSVRRTDRSSPPTVGPAGRADEGRSRAPRDRSSPRAASAEAVLPYLAAPVSPDGANLKGTMVMTSPRNVKKSTSSSRCSGLSLSGSFGGAGEQMTPFENARPLAEFPNSPTKPARGRTRIRAFVTGRDTVLGRAAIAELLARGHCVTVFGTGHEEDFKGVVTLVSSLAEAAAMRCFAQRMDAIIHCERPEPGKAQPIAAALCRMLAALPPHGRLISAAGVICPDCRDAAVIDQAILSASGSGPQSVHVLASTLPVRVRERSARAVRQHPDTLQPSERKLPARSETMTVEACARLLASLAENGAFRGGVVGCVPLETSLPTRPVHPARRRLGVPQAPEIFGYEASAQLSLSFSKRLLLHGTKGRKIGTDPAVAAPQGSHQMGKFQAS